MVPLLLVYVTTIVCSRRVVSWPMHAYAHLLGVVRQVASASEQLLAWMAVGNGLLDWLSPVHEQEEHLT